MADGITKIAVEGFKSIAKRQEIEIAPLTILAGANSSGKSSIMQPLLLLKQTLEATYDPGPLKIDGPNVKFTSTDQFLSRRQSELRIEIFAGAARFSVTLAKGLGPGFEIKEETRIFQGAPITLFPGMSPASIWQAVGRSFGLPENSLYLARDRFFLDAKTAAGPTLPIMSWIAPLIDQSIHVPGLRGNPSRTYPSTAAGPRLPGTFEPYTASLILHWQFASEGQYLLLNRELKHLGLAERVVARKLNDAELDLQVNRLADGESDDLVSVADVGFGVSQTLPVLVALRAAETGQLVYLEEPEIHLHPRAQTKLADVLADAAKRGVRVVAETHSTLLLTAIQTLVAKGQLDRKLVKFHWFQRDPKTGITQVSSTDLDASGAFKERDWPEDFDDVTLSAQREYLDAITERSTG